MSPGPKLSELLAKQEAPHGTALIVVDQSASTVGGPRPAGAPHHPS
ncbi:hypothetical protein [Streptomyces sp. NPDC056401]